MNIQYQNPGFEHSLNSILLFQDEDLSPFWTDSLLYFYPQIQKEEWLIRNADRKRQYLTEILSVVYQNLQPELAEKVSAYNRHFSVHQAQIEDALSDAFSLDSRLFFNDVVAHLTLNPICPRFLQAHTFDVFYKNSPHGALGSSLHEIIHFFWFHVWNKHFGDGYDTYESPSLKWILSEMVVECIMRDQRLSSLNPYFPRENGGCVYSYFQSMQIEAQPILETMDHMYRNNTITDFMELAYRYCQQHEQAIRLHIQQSEYGE